MLDRALVVEEVRQRTGQRADFRPRHERHAHRFQSDVGRPGRLAVPTSIHPIARQIEPQHGLDRVQPHTSQRLLCKRQLPFGVDATGATGVTPVTVAAGPDDRPRPSAAARGVQAALVPAAPGPADLCDTAYGTPIEAPSRVAIMSGREAIVGQAVPDESLAYSPSQAQPDLPSAELAIIVFDTAAGYTPDEHDNGHL